MVTLKEVDSWTLGLFKPGRRSVFEQIEVDANFEPHSKCGLARLLHLEAKFPRTGGLSLIHQHERDICKSI